MVSIRIDHAYQLSFHKLVASMILTRGDVCLRALGLDQHSFQIGCCECRFGRSPRVKTNEVEPVRLFNLVNAPPRVEVGWRKRGQREDGAFQCSAQHKRTPVHRKLRSPGTQFPHSEGHGLFIMTGGLALRAESRVQGIKVWSELVP